MASGAFTLQSGTTADAEAVLCEERYDLRGRGYSGEATAALSGGSRPLPVPVWTSSALRASAASLILEFRFLPAIGGRAHRALSVNRLSL